MRKLIGLALISLLLAVFWSVAQPSVSRLSAAQQSSQQMLQAHLGDLPEPAPMLAQAPAVPVKTERVTYATVDGKPVVGYLARPADATEPLPGLIVIHEWWGLNDNIETMTQRLAGEGYTALAVDLYGGQVAQTPDRAKELMQAALQNPTLQEDNLRQAYQYLGTQQKAPKIASIGWCFGGGWSLRTALLLPDQLDAAVIYYGAQLETDPDKLSTLQMPILGLFGSLDTNPSPATVHEFESNLNALDKTAEIKIYEGANHAFANPSGTRYNAEAAEDAWKRTLAFLDRYLKSSAS
jgi:carboxymethylenebutenolidase